MSVEDELNALKAEMGFQPNPERSLDDLMNEGAKRTGRIALWVTLPPVGIWRSVRHGRKKHEDRLAKKIAQELNRNAKDS